MKIYQEITLLPNEAEDVPLNYLWSRLYQQLHLAWVETKNDQGKVNTGLSFPQYDPAQKQLGCKVRLFAATEQELGALNLTKWLDRLNDYVHITSIRQVPSKISGYAVFKRLRPKSNNERLARRRAKRLNVSFEAAMEFFKDRNEVYSEAPFIQMTSLSSKHSFRLMISKQQVTEAALGQCFNTYGLSSEVTESTVPLF